MKTHLQRDLARVKKHVLEMGRLAEEAVDCARNAFSTLKLEDVEPLAEVESVIDRMQVDIDDEVLKVLALHQPVAGDLRFLMAALKIVNDLERIGDLTDSITQRLVRLIEADEFFDPLDLDQMMTLAAAMLRDSLHAFVELDTALARSVLARDDDMDRRNSKNFQALTGRMKQDPSQVDSAVALLSISRSLERIADLATNIAEDVIFVVDAEDIRHSGPPLEE